MTSFYEAFYVKAKEMIPNFLFNDVKAAAIPASGANARWRSPGPSAFEKVALAELKPDKLRAIDGKDLKTILSRLNKIYVSTKRAKGDTSSCSKVAGWIAQEMRGRNMTIDHKLAVIQEFIGKSDEEIAKSLEFDTSYGDPVSQRGYTNPETRVIVAEHGKFQKDQANYVDTATAHYVACSTCRFFIRDESDAPVAGCQVVDGPILWQGNCDLHISALDDAGRAFSIAHTRAYEILVSTELNKEDSMTDDDNSTGAKVKIISPTVKGLIEKMIKREGDEWVVYDSTGQKELGRHKDKASAVRQLAAIETHRNTEKAQPTAAQSHIPGVGMDDDEWDVKKEEIDLFVPIAKVDEDQRKVYGVVLEPNVVDTQGDTITAEEIEKAAEGFMKKSRAIGLRHRQLAEGVILTDSYVTQGATMLGSSSLKPGTWIIGVKVDNDGIWSGVKSGEFTGFSVGGWAAKKANKK